MKSKKVMAMMLSAAMCVSMMGGCGGSDKGASSESGADETVSASSAETTETTEAADTEGSEAADQGTSGAVSEDPVEKLTQGYFTYSYPVDGLGDMYNFFHFYEEAPVLGKVFYLGFAMGQINYAGTYEIEETEYAYSCYADRAAAEEGTLTDGTAPYTITMFDWDGNELGKVGYDGDIIYNDSKAGGLSAVSSTDNEFAFDQDGSETGYADYYAAEPGQVYLDFVADEDDTSILTLYHNGTYQDMVGMMVEGTWSMEESADGYTYVLTPNSDSDTGATFVVALDKATAVYTPDGGEAVNMSNKAAGPVVSYAFAGQFDMNGMTADLTAYCYEDNTAAVIASMSGMEMTVDQGTWEMTETYSMLFHLDGVGDIESAAGEDGIPAVQYTNPESQIGPLDVALTFAAEE